MDMCGDRLRLFISSFGLGTPDAGVFVRTQWRFPWMIWAVCRVVAALYYTLAMAGTFIFLLATSPVQAAGALVFVTDWTCILLTLYLILAVLNLILDRKHGRFYHYVDRDTLPSVDLCWRHRIQWGLMNVCANFSIIVTIVYWSFLRMPLPIIFDLTCHTFPSLIGILEVLLTPIPIRLPHVIYTWIYGGLYVSFTLIFYAADGESFITGSSEIYPNILDWAKPRMTVRSMTLVVVACFGSQLFLWGLYKLRMYIARRYGFVYFAVPVVNGRPSQTNKGENAAVLSGNHAVQQQEAEGAQGGEVTVMLDTGIKSNESQDV